MASGPEFAPLALDGGVFAVPVLHDRLESAGIVRRALADLAPDAVAVEVPSSLEQAWRRAIERLPAVSVLYYETAEGGTVYLPVHPADPAAEASRWAIERGVPLACIDLDVDGYADHRDPVPDSYALARLGLRVFLDAVRAAGGTADLQDGVREAAMAFHVQRLRRGGARRILAVFGMRHFDGLVHALACDQAEPFTRAKRGNVSIVNLHPESLVDVLGEPPFFVAAYEAQRRGLIPRNESGEPLAAGRDHGLFRVLSGGQGDDPGRTLEISARAARRAGDPLDRLRLQAALLDEAGRALAAAAPDERVERWQRRHLARFGRNLAHLSGALLPDLFDLVVAARACVSENFAWELYRLASVYPWQEESVAGLPTARIHADEMWDGVRRVRLTRRIRRTKVRPPESVLRRRRRNESYPGEWLSGFQGEMVCSYPPEDQIVEAFGGFLRKKGKSVLSEEASRCVPFTTSVLDGIDVRETIRHWTEKRIYVREKGRVPGEVGAVVVVFDEDTDPGVERFPYRLTWLGEHEQESDMAFYATSPEQGVVGPGICRAVYGGFLLSSPPGRLADVWTDADYRFAETKPEVLLLAALDYARERLVVYAASKPPRPIFQRVAARLDRKIVYLPLGTLSPATLRRMRVLHVLSGHDKRAVAKDYVW